MSKKIIKYLFILFPFLDLLTAIITRNYDISVTPGIVIKGLFMLYLVFFIIKSTSKYKRLSIIMLVCYFLYIVGYFSTKIELLNSLYMVGEITYLFKLLYFPIIFLGLLCFYDEKRFDKAEMINILKINLISFTILLIIPLLVGNAYTTYPEQLKGYIGWYFAGNEVANTMILLLPFMYYFISEKNKYNFLIFLPIIYIILLIGTKVSLLGSLIIVTLSFLFSFIKEKKINNYYSLVCFVILVSTVIFSFNSYAVQNTNYIMQHDYKNNELIIDSHKKDEVLNIENQINDFYNKNNFNKIFKKLLSGRDAYLANTLSIYNDDLTDTNIWFGIGFSNTKIINDTNITKLIEIDFLDGYFHYGLIGLLIMLSPFLIIIGIMIYIKVKITVDSWYFIFIILLMGGISCFSGHLLCAPAVSIYLVLILLILMNEFNSIGKNYELKNKISILSLHMGYGGIERSIINQANMLCINHEVEIICLYKLNNMIPYVLDERVKLIYLSNLKPNKDEFLYYYHHKNIIKVIVEGLKSVKILYLKHKLVKDYILNSDSKIIISTRLEFTKILNKYYNDHSVRIAEEHVFHHNNQKYINSLRKALKNINYLIPPSLYLTRDYENFFETEKVKVVYIPQTISHLPAFTNKCNNKNIIAVGRLVKEKGFLDLIEIMKLIVQKNNKIKLTIVGDGKQKNQILNLIKKYKLTKNVILTGFLNSKDLEKEYKKSSLFVMTSLEESFGLVLLEAMSFGIPCFAFDDALGAKEIINNKNGLLIKNRDYNIMVNEIVNYFEQKNHSMINEAKCTAEKYMCNEVQKQWDELIKNIIKKGYL